MKMLKKSPDSIQTPNPTNGTSNSQLFIMPKQQKYSVFEFGTGGVAVNPSDAYSSAGNPTSSQNIEGTGFDLTRAFLSNRLQTYRNFLKQLPSKISACLP